MQGLILLFCFQIAGQILQSLFFTMIPGPLIGMLLLFFSLNLVPKLYKRILPTTNIIFKHLMLIYIVYGAGLVNYESLIKDNGSNIMTIVAIAAAITIVLTGLISKRIKP
jgi:holin-like protein